MESQRTPKRRPDDGRRAQLIAAATRVVARDGVAAATTRRIAQEAGVPHGLVHYWFSGKDELLEEVVQGMLRQLEAVTSVPAATGSSGRSAAEDVIDRFRSAFAVVESDDRGRQIALFELTTWSLRSPDHREVARTQYAAYRATAASVTSAWLAEHKVELPGAPDVLAQFVAALFDGVNLAWLADPDGTRPDEIFALASTLLAQFARDNEDAVR